MKKSVGYLPRVGPWAGKYYDLVSIEIMGVERYHMLMNLPTREESKALVERYVPDEYQRHHALMVATALEGYAAQYEGDPHLWWTTGYLHDIDFGKYPNEHPGPSLEWFKEWKYPEELIHAVEAHAYGYNGFTTKPETKLAACLIACDELCGIFYAYKKLNPIPFGEMKAKSIKKRIKETSFAPKIERETIHFGMAELGVDVDHHVATMIESLSKLD